MKLKHKYKVLKDKYSNTLTDIEGGVFVNTNLDKLIDLKNKEIVDLKVALKGALSFLILMLMLLRLIRT